MAVVWDIEGSEGGVWSIVGVGGCSCAILRKSLLLLVQVTRRSMW